MPKKKKTTRNIVITIIIILIIFYLVYRLPLQGEVPEDMINKARELDEMSRDKMELAENTYTFVDNKFTSPIREYLKQPQKVILKDVRKIWELENEYVPSNTQNEIFRGLLLLTGKFKEEDFKFVQSYCYTIPLMFHEYYELTIENQIYFIDLWMADNSILDDTFGCYSPPPCNFEKYVCMEGVP